MAFSGLTDKDKEMARKIIKEFSKIDLRSPEERVEELLKKFRKEGEIAGFLPGASYKKLHGLLITVAGRTKYDIRLININGGQKTDKELEEELRKFIQQI